MAFGNSNDIDIRVKVDAAGAITVFDKLGNEIKSVQVESDKAGKALDSLGKNKGPDNLTSQFSALKSEIGLAAGAIGAVSIAIAGIVSAGIKGSGIADIRDSFDKLTLKAGVLGDTLLGQLDNAFGHTIAQTDLMKKSIELLQAKLDPKHFEELAIAARGLADQVGKDTTQVFDELADSIVKGNDRALKQYGIILDSTKAYEVYAQKLGTSSDALTENQKHLADQEYLYEQIAAKALEVGRTQNDVEDATKQFTSALQNQIDKVFEAIGRNDSLRTSIENLANKIAEVDLTPFIEFLSNAVTLTSKLFTALTDLFSLINRNKNAFLDLIPGGKQISEGLSLLNQSSNESAKSFTFLRNSGSQLARVLGDVEKETVRNTEKTKAHTTNVTSATKAHKDLNKELKKSEDEFKKLNDKVNELLGFDGMPQLEQAVGSLFDEFLKGNPIAGASEATLIALAAAVKKAGEEYLIAGGRADLFTSSVSNQTKLHQGNSNTSTSSSTDSPTMLNDFIQGIFGDVGIPQDALKGLASSIESALATSIGDALTAAIEGAFNGEDWKQLLRNLGASIGGSIGFAIGGPIGEAIGSVIGDQIMRGIASLFSSHDAGHEARKSVDAFFADLFNKNRLQVIVNGQIKSISDLVFDPSGGKGTSFEDGTFDNLFASLPDAARGAFAAVGTAFEELLAEMGIDTEAIAGQLGAILVNNIGGSMNNLQLLIQATGKTLEELGAAIEKAFNQGKISALEAARAILSLKGVMEKGIPGAVGAIKEAFENIQASVGKGGAALVDAIQDIAVEAEELGIHSLPALADALVKQFGFAATSVAQLMQAAAAAGIHSLDELANASKETLLAIAANLEAIKQGLAPTFTGDQLTTKAPSTSGIRSGGGSSRADQAKRDREQKASELAKLIQGSKQYEAILADLTNATISNGEAQKLLTSLYRNAKSALENYNNLQEKFNKQIEAGKTPTSQLVKKLQEAKDALDALNGTLSSTNSINQAFANFAKQYQGNFDLIQLAASQAGKSMEDFKRNAEEKFLSGAISVKEALRQIEDATGGISGERGAVGKALDNLISGGANGGLFSINALRGLAKESKEIGGTILTNLEEQLLGQGKSSDVVKKLFVSLKNEGVDTLDELANVSTETGIRILSGLEDISFPFQETNDEITRLNQELAKIPSSKDITINFKANFDDRTKSILERIGFDTGYGGSDDSPGLKKKKDKGKKKKGRR